MFTYVAMTKSENIFFKIEKICQCLPLNCSETPSWIFLKPILSERARYLVLQNVFSKVGPAYLIKEIKVPWNNLIRSQNYDYVIFINLLKSVVINHILNQQVIKEPTSKLKMFIFD